MFQFFGATPQMDQYWSNPSVLIFDIRVLSPKRQSARMSKIKTGGLDQYGAERFKY